MPAATVPPIPLLTLELRYEQDVVLARQRVRQLAELLGFDAQEQTRLATAVSEIARNAFQYAGGGRVTFLLQHGLVQQGVARDAVAPGHLVVRVEDRGPGIRDLDAVLAGRYRSETGMGLGLVGARRQTPTRARSPAPAGGTPAAGNALGLCAAVTDALGAEIWKVVPPLNSTP